MIDKGVSVSETNMRIRKCLIVGVIAGIIVLVYPMSSAVTLALVGGIWLIILGIMQVVAAFQLRGQRGKAGTTSPSAPAAV